MLGILPRLLLIPGKALMAALAVGRHAGSIRSIEMRSRSVALLPGDALADRVFAQYLGMAEGRDQLSIVLEIKLERVANLAIRSGGLEEHRLPVLRAVGRHAPHLGAVIAEILKFSWKAGHKRGNLLHHFGGERFRPSPGTLVAAGHQGPGAVFKQPALDMIGAPDQPGIDEAIFRSRS